MAKKPDKPKADGLKLNVPWEEATKRLLNTRPESVPPRQTVKRKTTKKTAR